MNVRYFHVDAGRVHSDKDLGVAYVGVAMSASSRTATASVP